jgi:hypothetical protein
MQLQIKSKTYGRKIFILAIILLSLNTKITFGEKKHSLWLKFIKKITIADAARPEIVATDNRVFVVYLGNIHQPTQKTFSIKIFNSDMTQNITSKNLVFSSGRYGSPTDIRIAADHNYMYVFYETGSMVTGKTYLWAAKYTLDDNFTKVAFNGPIASSTTFNIARDGDEKLDDPIVLITENSVFAITRYKFPFNKHNKTMYKVYEFSKDLSQKREFDLDLSKIADGGARQASALYHNGYFYMVLPTTVGPAAPIANITASDIVVVKLDKNWNVIESKIVSEDNANPLDAETYVTGFKADESFFYITYLKINIPKIDTEFFAPLNIYDKNFNLVKSEIIRSRKPSEPGLRPSLEVKGNIIFVGHSAGKLARGDAEIYIYKLEKLSKNTGLIKDKKNRKIN